ncbi:cytidylyltransferase domain-containing protein [Parasediminibacterium sp. JCM 36343]|uniref:cytidylyltransferase domain-containing protein n=1 Tax=Parasediminibacterium sp. JCM 36343 TaxID=3374279 RepID=UPI00397BCFA1
MVQVIAFMPVWVGSKLIPFKNIKLFCGKPLVYWNLVALQNCNLVDKVIVATDADIIEETVLKFGLNKVSVYRLSAEKARSTDSAESIMLEYLDTSQSTAAPMDLFMLVEAAAPLTETTHYTEAIRLMKYQNYESLLSCVAIKRFFWTKDGKPKNYDHNARPKRHDLDGELMENGAFYINSVENIRKYQNRISGNIGIYCMPEHSFVELEEEDDWPQAERMMKKYVLPKLKNKVKLFLTDVDGVLTDAGMYYSENGVELKKFNTHDGMAFDLLRKAGIKTGFVTSEDTHIVAWRAKKLKVDYLYQGAKYGGKLEAALAICAEEKIDITEVAYIGDDINCIQLLSSAGLAACPSDAVAEVKSISGIHILNTKGGDGVVREFVNKILANELP